MLHATHASSKQLTRLHRAWSTFEQVGFVCAPAYHPLPWLQSDLSLHNGKDPRAACCSFVFATEQSHCWPFPQRRWKKPSLSNLALLCSDAAPSGFYSQRFLILRHLFPTLQLAHAAQWQFSDIMMGLIRRADPLVWHTEEFGNMRSWKRMKLKPHWKENIFCFNWKENAYCLIRVKLKTFGTDNTRFGNLEGADEQNVNTAVWLICHCIMG